ncbi:Mor transcription activator family protein [Marinobacterium litorale]|uniref:Mor transcription activator family protein n=1 Tax=Marinobacterium litorale TaxID=404770 RepID=UPI00040A6A73|nr:Mor transcription activator family protein [Marinobacterium litorale]
MSRLQDLMVGDYEAVMKEEDVWILGFRDVIAIMEHELAARPALLKFIRPLLYMVCKNFGAGYLFVGCTARSFDFLKEKRIFDLWQKNPEEANEVAHLSGMPKATLKKVINGQYSNSAEDADLKQYQTEIAELYEFLDQQLSSESLPEKERWNITSALFRGLWAIRKESGAVYISSGVKIDQRVRNLEIMRHCAGGRPRKTARQFGISLQHVYRVVHEERKKQKEARDREMKPL